MLRSHPAGRRQCESRRKGANGQGVRTRRSARVQSEAAGSIEFAWPWGPIGTPHCSARVIQYGTVCRHLTDGRRKHRTEFGTPKSRLGCESITTTIYSAIPRLRDNRKALLQMPRPSVGPRVVEGSSRRRGRGRVGMGQRSDRRQRALVVVFRFQESDNLQGNAAAPTTRPIGIHLHSQPQFVGEHPDPR